MQALWMLVASVCFATMGLLIKLSAQQASLSEVILFRGLVPFVAISGWAVIKGYSLRSPAATLHLRRNIYGITAMWCGFYATTQLPLATAVTLMYTSPLFIVLALRFGQGIKSNNVESGAIIFGFAGVLAVLKPVFGSEQLLTALIGLAGGAIAAQAYLQLKQLGSVKEPEWRTVLYFAGTATVSGLALGASTNSIQIFTRTVDEPIIFYLLGVGFFGGAGNLALTRAFGAGSTWLSASLQYTTILFSTTYGIWVFNDKPEPSTWLGVSLIMLCGASSSLATHLQKKA